MAGSTKGAKVGPYILTDTLGVGAFGKVKRGRHTQTGAEVAVKIMDKGDIAANEFGANVKREIFIMRTLHHRNIVNLHEVLTSKTKLYMVMDLVRGGELFEKIEKEGELDEQTARRFFQQLVDGLVHCHEKGVCHRDLKPENLLIDENSVLKITDFGVSSMRDASASGADLLQTSCGTPYYVAPEVLFANKRGGYDGYKADAWSCGVILFLLLSGELPFMNEDMNKLYDEIKSAKIKWPKEIKGDSKALCQKLLERDPSKRLSLQEVRSQKWFVVDYEKNLAELQRYDKPAAGMKSPSRLSDIPSQKKIEMSQSQSVVGNVDDDDDDDLVENERVAMDMQRPVVAVVAKEKGAKLGLKKMFKLKNQTGVTPRGGGGGVGVGRNSSFESFQDSMHSSLSSQSIRQSGSRENIQMQSTASSAQHMTSPKSNKNIRPSSSAIEIEGAEEIEEGPKDLRGEFKNKDMKEFVATALPGKPDKKLDEIVEKLSNIDVDCVDDLQVKVEEVASSAEFKKWLEEQAGIPDISAARISKMFYS
ncbi:CBL-interacting protein kinase 8 [Porphyridium purpureum]|uniref:non-specific serine/threonine protein kinase n=1 Tax=Porphyridium purpureum TaxID=35688 RepID=A0A5J4YH96_PORPP|nr:CBL-interacting protein kinase 8 [Porphyridium purpureum]|eukprot:POR8099..scf251_18